MLNSVILMGRLTADPELKTTASNISVVSFSIAVERNYTDKQSGTRQTDFIDIVAWRSTADFVSRYFRKGQLVAVQGSLQVRSYEDRDGNKRRTYEVVADNCYFAEAKRSSDASPSRYDSALPGNEAADIRELASRANSIDVPITAAGESEEGFTPLPDDDLPF